jgi:hypothetical protein
VTSRGVFGAIGILALVCQGCLLADAASGATSPVVDVNAPKGAAPLPMQAAADPPADEGGSGAPRPSRRNIADDKDGDGLPDDDDQCDSVPEDHDGFFDADGCPDYDNDGDSIPDADDMCPNEPETKNGVKDDDGCPDGNLYDAKKAFQQGVQRFQTGDYAGARKFFEEAYRFQPNDAILFNLARAAQLQGDRPAACRYYNQWRTSPTGGHGVAVPELETCP